MNYHVITDESDAAYAKQSIPVLLELKSGTDKPISTPSYRRTYISMRDKK